MNFFSELKRRNVFRVGIAYAVAAWVLLQIVDLVLDNIASPEWVMQVFMLALAIGFPIAILMAWAFEMTPDGIKREADVDRTESITAKTGQSLNRIIIASLLLAVIFLIIDPFEDSTQPGPGESTPVLEIAETPTQNIEELEKSVAVLPFANRSTNPDDEFFAEGMHDDLLTQLAKIGSIKVISRTSVLAYKDTTMKIPQIAEELGVTTIVEAGIQRSGSRIRINAQLINASTDEHLWAETYNRELTAENLFDIQAEIARSIAQALKATLSPQEEANIDRVLTNNLDAWQSYQRALRVRQSLTIENTNAGISEIDRAITLDPNFAAAWSLKAIMLMQKFWLFDTRPEVRDAARDAIQSGRAIDPTLPELDIAEGYYYYWGFRDYEQALAFLDNALTALPNSAEAHVGRGYVLRRMGSWTESLAAMRMATQLDPVNYETFGEMGNLLTHLHRFDEAAEVYEFIQAIAPEQSALYWQFADFHMQSTGETKKFSHFLHLSAATNPGAQMMTLQSSLYLDDYDAAFEDVKNWSDKYLDSKDFFVTRQMLNGLVWRYAGDPDKAEPLLGAARQELESLLVNKPGTFAILRSLCWIAGGQGDLKAAKQHCTNALSAAPKDAWIANHIEFDVAAGLALAGDTQSAIDLLAAILASDFGRTLYEVIYHPAFDGIRQDEAYIELLNTYAGENLQP